MNFDNARQELGVALQKNAESATKEPDQTLMVQGENGNALGSQGSLAA